MIYNCVFITLKTYLFYEEKSPMSLLKKLALALLVSVSMLAAVTPSAMAAGKIQNQSPEGVLQAFDDAIAAVEAAQDAINSNADKDTVLALLKTSKQELNRIESATVNRAKEKANGILKKARSAYKKDQHEIAKVKIKDAVAAFKGLKQIYLNF